MHKPVIVGHFNYTGTDQPFVYRDKVYGLDTDCVTGKSLTGILLPSFQFVSVPSRGNLWMQVRRSYAVTKAKPSPPRVSGSWSEAQNQELNLLFEMLQEANRRLMVRIQTQPGFMDRPSRQQAKLYSELVGQGAVANLLHLVRLGKLDIDKIRTIVRDPGQVSLLIQKVGEISGDAQANKGLARNEAAQSDT